MNVNSIIEQYFIFKTKVFLEKKIDSPHIICQKYPKILFYVFRLYLDKTILNHFIKFILKWTEGMLLFLFL